VNGAAPQWLLVQLSIAASAVRIATPLALAATGETICERAGVVNIGIEGIMLAGALASFLATHATANPIIGIAAALAIGLLLGGLFAAWTLLLRADQVVAGLGLNLFAFGAAGTAYRIAVGATGSDVRVAELGTWAFPGLARLPVVGPSLFVQEPLAWTAMALVAAVAWLLARSNWGVALRAVGDEPRAAEAAGVSVIRVRAAAILAGALFAALAGADLELAHARAFSEDLTGGRGFMALAIVLFGRWSPGYVALAALFFGAAQAVQVALQAQGLVAFGFDLSRARELVLALPYVLTLVVLALPRRKARDVTPGALGVPYKARS
jgi:simple sugar transport system permease protein